MRAARAVLAVALLLPPLVEGGSFHEHKSRDGVQVWQSSSKGRDVMWGRCSGWFRKMRSCILEETTCAAHLSQGPADADVEVRIGNLPVFKNHPVFVQWWAPRKSREPYDPLANPEDAEVYDSMFEAYPRYSDPDFNGGNVQVDRNGEAVIRFRAPATYRMHTHTRVPHVHLRICSGGAPFSIILGRKDKIQLTPQGPVAKSECNSPENKLSVLGFRRLGEYSTTTPKPLVASGLGLVRKVFEQMDLDTLEFSPVFQCLVSGLYYDHTAGDCVGACPAGTAISRGQCVKPARSANSFHAEWRLLICGCDETCWADKRNATLHRLRLEIAGHLDILMHEVEDLDLTFDAANGDPHRPSLARLRVRVASPRHTAETGAAMLRSLFQNMEVSSEVLAMLVLGVQELFARDLGFLHRRAEVGPEDAFASFYKDLAIVKASEGPERLVPPLPGHLLADVEEAGVKAAPARNDPWLATCGSAAVAGIAMGSLAAGALATLLKWREGSQAREPSQLRRNLGQPLAAAAPDAANAGAPQLLPGSRTIAPASAAGPMTVVCGGAACAEKGSTVAEGATQPVGQYLAKVYARALF